MSPVRKKAAGSLRARVISVVRGIPPGRVATYGDVAAWSGFPGAARAVGHVMATSTGLDAPCHRVVASDGSLGGFTGDLRWKRGMLALEGVDPS